MTNQELKDLYLVSYTIKNAGLLDGVWEKYKKENDDEIKYLKKKFNQGKDTLFDLDRKASRGIHKGIDYVADSAKSDIESIRRLLKKAQHKLDGTTPGIGETLSNKFYDLTHKNASDYAIKNAGAWDDFVNWLRELLGMRHRNTFGENVGATMAGLAAGGGAAYGLHQGYNAAQKLTNKFDFYSQPTDKLINNIIDKKVKSLKGNKDAVNTWFVKNPKKAAGAVGRLASRGSSWAKSPLISEIAKRTKQFNALPKYGKWGVAALPILAATGIGAKTYDSIFNG